MHTKGQNLVCLKLKDKYETAICSRGALCTDSSIKFDKS